MGKGEVGAGKIAFSGALKILTYMSVNVRRELHDSGNPPLRNVSLKRKL